MGTTNKTFLFALEIIFEKCLLDPKMQINMKLENQIPHKKVKKTIWVPGDMTELRWKLYPLGCFQVIIWKLKWKAPGLWYPWYNASRKYIY